MTPNQIKLVDEIKNKIDLALVDVNKPVAAFDADGTLWPIDLGESFFNYQIDQNLLPALPEEPWKHYEKLQTIEHKSAYLWLAQVNKDHPIETVRNWAQEAVDKNPQFSTFAFQKEIVSYLQEKNVEVYIVTASIKWAVEPGAKAYGIPQENVIGIETMVENNLVTDTQKGPITYREGKVKKLLEYTGGTKPFFSSGNTLGDLALLESASHVQLTVSSAPSDDRNYESEQELKSIATKNNWYQIEG